MLWDSETGWDFVFVFVFRAHDPYFCTLLLEKDCKYTSWMKKFRILISHCIIMTIEYDASIANFLDPVYLSACGWKPGVEMVLRWAWIVLDGFKTAQQQFEAGSEWKWAIACRTLWQSSNLWPQTKLSPYIFSQKMKFSVIYRDHKLVTDGNVVRLEDVLCQRRGEGQCIVNIVYIKYNT